MKISGQRNYQVSLESVAMTDIVLNMFIFFFISFSLLYTFSPERVKKLDVSLPEAKSATALKEKKQVTVTITNEGVVYLDKEIVNRQELKARISKLHKNNPALGVVLSSDKFVRFQDIVEVLDTLNQLGIKNLNIAATTEH